MRALTISGCRFEQRIGTLRFGLDMKGPSWRPRSWLYCFSRASRFRAAAWRRRIGACSRRCKWYAIRGGDVEAFSEPDKETGFVIGLPLDLGGDSSPTNGY